mmetsp:Transcript_5357/g.11388  ORF Transcript_5357/g.11388 Transcript_5357/m.11388 type:complete len:305 (+) Transcript_5357:76-990(+)
MKSVGVGRCASVVGVAPTAQRLRASRLMPNTQARIARGVQVARASTAGDLPTLLLFDCDGVLVETERDGHRIAFNEAFVQKGLPEDLVWDVDLYGELLAVGGGKERMKHDFSNRIAGGDEKMAAFVEGAGGLDAVAKDLHALKTQIMMDMVEANMMPPRPGIRDLIGAAAKAGVRMAICSTSNEKAVRAVLKSVLDAGEPLGVDIDDIPIYAGDMVPRKKPDPAVYELAAKEMLGEDSWKEQTQNCVVIEDSKIGAAAAKAAGMKCMVTLSIYTESEKDEIEDLNVDKIFGSAAEFSLDQLMKI